MNHSLKSKLFYFISEFRIESGSSRVFLENFFCVQIHLSKFMLNKIANAHS